MTDDDEYMAFRSHGFALQVIAIWDRLMVCQCIGCGQRAMVGMRAMTYEDLKSSEPVVDADEVAYTCVDHLDTLVLMLGNMVGIWSQNDIHIAMTEQAMEPVPE